MSTIGTTKLERENLEAHVDLCAQRYQILESRLSTIEVKVENIHADVMKGNQSMSKVIITSAGTIVAGLLGLIATLIIKF
jgi:tetrahydromethanopterin S-methyltransferase subunit G